MSEQNPGQAIPGEAQPNGAGGSDQAAIEAKAREMGWRPPEQFNGDPSQYRDAEEFIKRGEEMLPIIRSRLDRTAEENKQLKAEIAKQKSDFDKRVQRLEHTSTAALQTQRQQLIDHYEGKMRDAAENGDPDAYDRLRDERNDKVKEIDKAVESAEETAEIEHIEQPAQQQPKFAPEVDQWRTQNPWFGTDPILTSTAQAYSAQLQQEHPGLTVDQNLAQVRKFMESKFPEKFSLPEGVTGGQTADPAIGGSRQAGASVAGQGAAQLPPEARQAGEGFVKEGLYENLEDYAKDYFAEVNG